MFLIMYTSVGFQRSPTKIMFCFKKVHSFLFFFFNFVLHLSQFDCRCLILAKVPLLRLSLNFDCLMLSFRYYLTSQVIKFWVKCQFCFVYALSFMSYSKQRERHKKMSVMFWLCTVVYVI